MKQPKEKGRLLALLRLLWLTFRLNPGWSMAIFAITTVMGLIPVLQVLLLRRLINTVGELAGGGSLLPSELSLWLILLALFFTVPNLAYSLLPILQGGYREANTHGLRRLVLQRLSTLELLQHEEPVMRDQLNRVERSLAVGIQPWSESIIWFFQSLIMVVALSFVLWEAHWSIWLLAVLGGSIHLATEAKVQRGQYQLFANQTPLQRWEQYLSGLLTDTATRRDLLIFDATRGLLNRWRGVVAELRQEQWSLQRRNALLSLGGKLLFLLVYLMPMGLLIWRQSMAQIDIGLLAAVFSAMSGFYAGLSLLVMTTASWVGQGLHAADLLTFLAGPQAEPLASRQGAGSDGGAEAGQSANSPKDRHGVEICCDQVSFQYPGQAQFALEHLSFTISPGEWIAVVGENGSGKSTLMRLLLGLYRPSSGRLEVAGRPAADAGPRSAVMQEFGRYALRVRENIGFGHLPSLADDQHLHQVAEQVGLSLNSGSPLLETELGREFGGLEPSGGQWQRLALARGEVGPHPLVVLDEATSALDPIAEDRLLRGLREHLAGATVIFVAHRLPVARLADRILVMQEGRLVEMGCHTELLDRDERYAAMYRSQATWYQPVPAQQEVFSKG